MCRFVGVLGVLFKRIMMLTVTKKRNSGFAVLEVLAVLLIIASIMALTAPKFIHMKSYARKQVLSSVANQLDRSRKFIRASAYVSDLLQDSDRFFILCFSGYENPKCGKEGYIEDMISTKMILIQRGYPVVAARSVLAPLSMLGYEYTADSYSSLKEKINQDVMLFETCGTYCNLEDLNSVCGTDICVQDSTKGALILLNGVSAADQCYVRYFRSGGKSPEIEVVSKGC